MSVFFERKMSNKSPFFIAKWPKPNNENTQKNARELLRRERADSGRNFFKGQIEVAPPCFIFCSKVAVVVAFLII